MRLYVAACLHGVLYLLAGCPTAKESMPIVQYYIIPDISPMYRIAMRTVVYDTLTCELTTDRTGKPTRPDHATRLAFHGLSSCHSVLFPTS